MNRPAAALLAAALAATLAAPLHAQAPPRDPPVSLFLELWAEREPTDGEEGTARRLLEEARQVLSAMVYGYRFRYVPADAARQVPETFILEPIGEVAGGDPALHVLASEQREGRLYTRLEYRLDEAQAARRAAWASNTIPAAVGTGEAPLFQGLREKQAALEAGLREAIRGHLRPLLFNKPREVSGEVLLWDGPRTWVRAGAYLTRVSTRVRIVQIVPYRIF